MSLLFLVSRFARSTLSISITKNTRTTHTRASVPFVALRRVSATMQTEIFDAVERIEVEDGWVSMRLREDKGSGAPLLMALN